MAIKTTSADEEQFEEKNLIQISKENLKEYGKAVILNRALADYRDGLKPVHRRILWTMFESKLKYNGPRTKAAHVVGTCMGKYHPHGDAAIYDAMVKMVNSPVQLIDGEGSFGTSIDDDIAAMRYTEVRLSKYSDFGFFPDYVEKIVPFIDSYDGQYKEPLYLPCLVPNLFLNGTFGVAVGITGNIPPLSMESLMPFIEQTLNGKEINPKKLVEKLQFNWKYGSYCISDEQRLLDWIENGGGSLQFEPEHTIDHNSRTLTVTETPPFFNWVNVVKRLAKVEKSGKLRYPFISAVDDMSDKTGVALEVRFKNTVDKIDVDKYAKLVLKEFTNSFSCSTNVTLRKKSEPIFIRSNIIDLIKRWCRYRVNIEVKMREYELSVIEKDLAYFDLLLIVVENRDYIRDAWNKTDPHAYVQQKLKITEEQTKQVLSWNLLSPSNLNKQKILNDKAGKLKERKEVKIIIDNPLPTVISYLSNYKT